MAARLIGGRRVAFGVLALGAWGSFTACQDTGSPTPCSGTSCVEAGGAGGAESEAGAGMGEDGGRPDAGGTSAKAGSAGASGSAGSAGSAGEPNENAGAAGQPESLGGAGGSGETVMGGAAGATNSAPQVIAVSPEDAAADAEPTDEVVITFSEPLDAASATEANIALLDGATPIPASVTYADGKVTLTPSQQLSLLASYTVTVGTGVADEQGTHLLEAYSSTFSVRDGAWHLIEAMQGSVYQISPTLPITATGDVLAAWTSIHTEALPNDQQQTYYCPATATWFAGAQPISAVKALGAPDTLECRSIVAGANAAGTAATIWQEDDGDHAQQFRAGQWLDSNQHFTNDLTTGRFHVAVAPGGSVTLLESTFTNVQAWRTDATGTWLATPDAISSERAMADARIAFNAAGNGFAAWRARDATKHEQVLVSRYTTGGGQWEAASVLPGSLAALTGVGYERGSPNIALDDAGNAIALWTENEAATSTLMSSRYDVDTGWAEPEPISGNLLVKTLSRSALAFDGKTFVAAFTAQDGAFVHTYSLRYDVVEEAWGDYELRTPVAELPSLAHMPELAADQHGNLLLVWARSVELAYQRYNATLGTWSGSTSIPQGALDDALFEAGSSRMPLAMAKNGRAAVMWADRDGAYFKDVHLASFF